MTILWEPSQEKIAGANLTAFQKFIEQRFHQPISGYESLHHWSINHSDLFWLSLWDWCGVTASQRGERALIDADKMPGAKFFPDARLNFSENLLAKRDESEAIVFRCENGWSTRLTYKELYQNVARLAQALRDAGVKPGDRIAAYLPNIPETITAMLAAAAIGAIWSSCSPDFGVKGVLDRIKQIEPKILIACDGYFYNGKQIEIFDKVKQVAAALPTLEHLLIVPFMRTVTGAAPTVGGIAKAQLLGDFQKREATAIAFEQLPFSHPLYILFSSGTTGLPKCIVHSAGGTLLQHLKEHNLHCDLKPGDRLFYFTTCGWMMWNWLASGLASGVTLLLYDGSPFYPDGNVLWEFTAAEGCTHFGTSAKYLQAAEKAGIKPGATHDLKPLRQIMSTGSPLLPEGFDYVYHAIKQDLCLSSISGGTDIVSCFVLGNPTAPVHRGEIQAKGLGMAVAVWDEHGQAVVGEKGELVCTRPFPSMPIGFWNDEGGVRYHAAYFDRYPNTWTQGDFAEETTHGGLIIYGRSDAVLNPGGVRIGTAEIYRQVELFDEVLESVAIGQEWEGDLRVVLFVVLRDGVDLDGDLIQRLQRQIRLGASPRHVPEKIVKIREIPKTRSGKIVELAIRDVVHGREIKNVEAIANPEALDQFRQRPELQS